MVDNLSNYKISVLITFYNQEAYVDRALESIFSQHADFKIKLIIGDDGSSDNTVNKINEWMQKYPDSIELYIMERGKEKPVAGFRTSKNRLNILSKVKTKYFIFLDGDDYFSDNNKLQMQYEILENQDNYDCIGCAHNIEALFNDGTVKPYINLSIPEGKYGIKEYWKKLYFHTDTILFRSEVINKLDLNLLEHQYNDNMITFSAMQFGKLYYIPKFMAVYAQTGNGIWTTGNLITNNLRNIFLYDISNKLNPSLKSETNMRFASSWRALFKYRKSIEINNGFLKEADEKQLYYSKLWSNYPNLSKKEKMALFIKSLGFLAIYHWKRIKKIPRKISRHIKHA